MAMTIILKILKNNRQTYRKDLNEPLVIEYPVESIIPIYKPGTPSEHVWLFSITR